ncbi:hypothetical protein RRF57_010512 [Xylaria bambusicola]|uniref:Uncharacterized protein n=1 Tax=Xylaria bambusicola TaxID=326684 RepID=A0AAN7V1I3_9PEZI
MLSDMLKSCLPGFCVEAAEVADEIAWRRIGSHMPPMVDHFIDLVTDPLAVKMHTVEMLLECIASIKRPI